MIYCDTETCGFVGPCVLIQHAGDEGPVQLHHVWSQPARATLALIERIADQEVCGWNLAFDWFHIQRTYNVLALLPPWRPPTAEGWRSVEKRAAVEGECVKPRSALDLFLHARKGPLQSLMGRKPIRVRKVPERLAHMLAEELERSVPFDPIFFERRKDGYRWSVQPCDDRPGFADVVLRFAASAGLKPVARHLLGAECLDLPVEKSKRPVGEREWYPCDPEPWRHLLAYHVVFWASNARALRYAADDVDLLRQLRSYWGDPPAGDDDSVLACQTASSRWRGYAIDARRVEALRDAAAERRDAAPRAPQTVLHRLHELLPPVVRLESTDAATLERVIRHYGDEPAGAFASAVKAARTAEKLVVDCEKLLTAGRLHPAVKVIGAKSGRMSGAGGFNVQGLSKQDPGKDLSASDVASMREALPLAGGNLPVLDGGDFDAFEVGILEACAADPALRAAVLSGKKFHAVFGSELYEAPYEEVVNDVDRYTRAKSAVFASVYGAQIPKVAAVLGLSVEQTQAGYDRFMARYPGVAREQALVFDRFCSMRQPGGIGSYVEWHDPSDTIESLYGYSRSFELENRVTRALYDLGQDPPTDWRKVRLQVERTKGRKQTASGALQSALFGAAFQLQAANMRAAGNHRIQSTGAEITKRLQRRLWDAAQPYGVHPWRVSPLNVHDEIMAPRAEGVDLHPTVAEVLDEYRPTVPLISMTWKTGLKNWGEK